MKKQRFMDIECVELKNETLSLLVGTICWSTDSLPALSMRAKTF